MINHEYTIEEELVNSITHGIGVGLGVAALIILTIFSAHQQSTLRVVSGVVFGCSVIMLYLSSTLYHSIHLPRTRRLLKTLDHTSIYVLIAGSYTPFCLVSLGGDWGWSLFGVIWGIAVAGILFKLFFVYKYNFVSTLCYLLMGWIVIIAIKPLIQHLPFDGLMWLIAGGLFYTLGVFFYLQDGIKFAHGIWHLFVLAGTICHFFAILFYVIL